MNMRRICLNDRRERQSNQGEIQRFRLIQRKMKQWLEAARDVFCPIESSWVFMTFVQVQQYLAIACECGIRAEEQSGLSRPA